LIVCAFTGFNKKPIAITTTTTEIATTGFFMN
jgi:hypothetical protein